MNAARRRAAPRFLGILLDVWPHNNILLCDKRDKFG